MRSPFPEKIAQVFKNLFVLERHFLVPICSGNLGNRSLCGLELEFLSENNHEAEMLKNLDEFLV